MRISAKNVNFSYNKKAKFATLALDNVTLEILEGEFFGVIGHTGSGKSTFIQHLNALLPLQEGEMTVGEFDLKVKKKKDKTKFKDLRKKVGVVFQYPEYQLFAQTVFEDVAFGIKNFYPEKTDGEVIDLVKTALEKVGLNYFEVKDKSPFDLSGGQKRRVALAGVIAVNPEILVLDEPCAGLDPAGKTELWNLLHSLHKTTAKTIIIVSHDMNDVCEHCTKAALFSKGKIVSVGEPKELFKSHELIKEANLEVPVTAYLTKELSGILEINSSFSLDDFCENLKDAILKNKR